jgi:hypothetical protein
MADGVVELKLKDYTIVTNTTVATLIASVKANLSSGWSLIGPPYFDGSTHNQGMVKFQPIDRKGQA